MMNLILFITTWFAFYGSAALAVVEPTVRPYSTWMPYTYTTTDSCPDGYEILTDQAECETMAARAIGDRITSKRQVSSQCSKTWPPANTCFIWTKDNGVRYSLSGCEQNPRFDTHNMICKWSGAPVQCPAISCEGRCKNKHKCCPGSQRCAKSCDNLPETGLGTCKSPYQYCPDCGHKCLDISPGSLEICGPPKPAVESVDCELGGFDKTQCASAFCGTVIMQTITKKASNGGSCKQGAYACVPRDNCRIVPYVTPPPGYIGGPPPADCLLGGFDKTQCDSCGKVITQTIISGAINGGKCNPGSYTCVPGDGSCNPGPYIYKGMCPSGYDAIPQNLDGSGKSWAQPHPDDHRSINDCAYICDTRPGCTSFEFAVGPKETGACGTYTGGSQNIKSEQNRLDPSSNWRSCVKSSGEPPKIPILLPGSEEKAVSDENKRLKKGEFRTSQSFIRAIQPLKNLRLFYR